MNMLIQVNGCSVAGLSWRSWEFVKHLMTGDKHSFMLRPRKRTFYLAQTSTLLASSDHLRLPTTTCDHLWPPVTTSVTSHSRRIPCKSPLRLGIWHLHQPRQKATILARLPILRMSVLLGPCMQCQPRHARLSANPSVSVSVFKCVMCVWQIKYVCRLCQQVGRHVGIQGRKHGGPGTRKALQVSGCSSHPTPYFSSMRGCHWPRSQLESWNEKHSGGSQ